MWEESAPERKAAQEVDKAMVHVENEIQNSDKNRCDAAWKSDTLKLARDCTQCAKLLQAAALSERTLRLAKITHMKEQNQIGAQFVSSFCEKMCCHVPFTVPDVESKQAQAWLFVFERSPMKH